MWSLGSAKASAEGGVYVASVVMGTDGQMRAKVNGAYLTRQQQKDGFVVLDMDYERVLLEYQGEQVCLSLVSGGLHQRVRRNLTKSNKVKFDFVLRGQAETHFFIDSTFMQLVGTSIVYLPVEAVV
ncbi:MAG: hypothetical protein WCS28_01205 [Thiomicrospira sp.]